MRNRPWMTRQRCSFVRQLVVETLVFLFVLITIVAAMSLDYRA